MKKEESLSDSLMGSSLSWFNTLNEYEKKFLLPLRLEKENGEKEEKGQKGRWQAPFFLSSAFLIDSYFTYCRLLFARQS